MRVFSFHGYYCPLEGADSFDSVKQRIIENYKGNFRADEWNLAEIRCNRVKMQPGLIDMSQFNMCDAKCDDSEGDDGDGGIAGKRITGKFTFVDGELYTTADCYRYPMLVLANSKSARLSRFHSPGIISLLVWMYMLMRRGSTVSLSRL